MMDKLVFYAPLFVTEHNPVVASDCKTLIVETCNVHFACELNQLWHSRFPNIHWSNVVRNKHYICFILHDQTLIYGAAIWSSPVARLVPDHSQTLELRRMALADYAPRNAASFMLSKMRKTILQRFSDIKFLISYQDTSCHHGTIYKADNWKIVRTSKSGDGWENRKRNKVQSNAAKICWQWDQNQG